jgi:Spy/CpxP family protein refolding chaperone
MVKTWQVVLATIGIFVAGLVTGGATALGVVKWNAHRHGPKQDLLGNLETRRAQSQTFGPQLIRSFANQLDLTDDQRATIGLIVKNTVTQLSHDRREVQLATALAIEKMQDEIAAALTPDQRAKFEELIAQQRARLQQFRQGESPHPTKGAQQAPK